MPVAVITYAPAARLATTNEALSVPPEIEQAEVLTGLPDSEQLVSLDENPEPATKTTTPTFADVGLRVTNLVTEVVAVEVV